MVSPRLIAPLRWDPDDHPGGCLADTFERFGNVILRLLDSRPVEPHDHLGLRCPCLWKCSGAQQKARIRMLQALWARSPQRIVEIGGATSPWRGSSNP
jgi:hypothetical protein